MPEDLDPAHVLDDVDHPRPLPPELHQRLTERLLGAAGEPTRALPLTPELSARLSGELLGAAGEEPPAAARRSRLVEELRSRWTIGTSAAAAVVLLLAALAGIAFHPGANNANHAAASSSGAAGSAGLSAGSGLVPTTSPLNTGSTGASASSNSSSQAALAAGGAPGAGGAGTATNPAAGQSSGGFAAAAPAAAPLPTVSSVSPNQGPVTGGTSVTITGEGLGGATAVHFGSSSATQVQVISDNEVRAVSPTHLPGAVDVVVVTPQGLSPTSSADTFTYTTAPGP